MTTKRDKIRKLHTSTFTGREEELALFRSLLPLERSLAIDILVVYGIGGMGKSRLLDQFQQVATENSIPTARIAPQVQFTIYDFLMRVYQQLKPSLRFPQFEKGLKYHEEIEMKLVRHGEIPRPVLRMFVKGTFSALKSLLDTSALNELMSEKKIEEHIGKIYSIVGRKEGDFWMKPGENLTDFLVADLNGYCATRRLVLFADTYELMGTFDEWLRERVFANLGEHALLVIAGRNQLKHKGWQEFSMLIRQHELQPFDTGESGSYLQRKGITDEHLIAEMSDYAGGHPLMTAHLIIWVHQHILSPLVRLVHKPRHTQQKRLAILIDGENTHPDIIEPVLTEVGGFGVIKERRIYGNWTAPNMHHWRETCIRHGFQSIHTVPAKAGKNATDIALVIDAIDLVQRGELDGICLVASDSDYTPLIMRLRAAGLFVLGIGDNRTPPALIQACSVYRSLERPGNPQLPGAGQPSTPSTSPTHQQTEQPGKKSTPDNGSEKPEQPRESVPMGNKPSHQLLKTWQAIFEEKGFVTLSMFVVKLKENAPDLQPTDYGYKKLGDLIRGRTDLFTCISDQKPSEVIVKSVKKQDVPPDIRNLLVTAWKQSKKQDGWLDTATLGSSLRQIDPTFNIQQYGHKKLSELVQACSDTFEIQKSPRGQYQIRLRNQ
jgi:hypothetical protein